METLNIDNQRPIFNDTPIYNYSQKEIKKIFKGDYSLEFIQNVHKCYTHHLDWDHISNDISYLLKHQHLLEHFFKDFYDRISWDILLYENNVPDQFLYPYTEYINWSRMLKDYKIKFDLPTYLLLINEKRISWIEVSKYAPLTTEFIDKYANKLCWISLCKFQDLEICLVDKYKHRIDWLHFSEYQKLTEEKIKLYSKNILWKLFKNNKNIINIKYSDDFILKYHSKFNLTNILTSNTSLSKETIKRICKSQNSNTIDFWNIIMEYQENVDIDLMTYFFEKYNLLEIYNNNREIRFFYNRYRIRNFSEFSIEFVEKYDDCICWNFITETICKNVENYETFITKFEKYIEWDVLNYNGKITDRIFEENFDRISSTIDDKINVVLLSENTIIKYKNLYNWNWRCVFEPLYRFNLLTVEKSTASYSEEFFINNLDVVLNYGTLLNVIKNKNITEKYLQLIYEKDLFPDLFKFESNYIVRDNDDSSSYFSEENLNDNFIEDYSDDEDYDESSDSLEDDEDNHEESDYDDHDSHDDHDSDYDYGYQDIETSLKSENIKSIWHKICKHKILSNEFIAQHSKCIIWNIYSTHGKINHLTPSTIKIILENNNTYTFREDFLCNYNFMNNAFLEMFEKEMYAFFNSLDLSLFTYKYQESETDNEPFDFSDLSIFCDNKYITGKEIISYEHIAKFKPFFNKFYRNIYLVRKIQRLYCEKYYSPGNIGPLLAESNFNNCIALLKK